MSNFSIFNAGSPEQWRELSFEHPAFKKPTRGKFFLGQPLGLTGMEVSLNSLPAGASIPFLHSHREHEELYMFLSGSGELLVDGAHIPVRAGSAVRIAPAGKRSWRNTGDVPLVYLVIQATAGSLISSGIGDGVPVPGINPWRDPIDGPTH